MAKDREDRAHERLAKAQRKLASLQEEYTQAQSRGEDMVRLAHERAEKRVAKTRKRLERQAQMVAKREDRLLAFTAPRLPAGKVASPEAAADLLASEATPEVQVPDGHISRTGSTDASGPMRPAPDTHANGPGGGGGSL